MQTDSISFEETQKKLSQNDVKPASFVLRHLFWIVQQCEQIRANITSPQNRLIKEKPDIDLH